MCVKGLRPNSTNHLPRTHLFHSVYIIAFYEIAYVDTVLYRFLSRKRAIDRFDARTPTPLFQFPDKNATQPSRERHFRPAELIAD